MIYSLPHKDIDYIEGTNIPVNSNDWIQTNLYSKSRATKKRNNKKKK